MVVSREMVIKVFLLEGICLRVKLLDSRIIDDMSM